MSERNQSQEEPIDPEPTQGAEGLDTGQSQDGGGGVEMVTRHKLGFSTGRYFYWSNIG